jgi:acyl-coenzyme A thioesterase PaaI-like protein
MEIEAVQDHYAEDFSHCYGCGRLNEHGHQIKTQWDGEKSRTLFRPLPVHTALPGFIYGGLIASLIDCTGTGTAAAATWEAGTPQPFRYVTASLHVDYLRPTPIDCELELTGSIAEIQGKKVVVAIELRGKGEVCARGQVVAVKMPKSMLPKST